MCSVGMTSAAVPPLASARRRSRPVSEFLRMPGIFFGCVLLLSLLLCYEAVVLLAYGKALQELSRIYAEMKPSYHDGRGASMGSELDDEDRRVPPSNARDHP